MADETITLRIVAQDLASGNISKFVAGLDTMARRGGLMGSVLQGVGQSFGQMLNPIALVSSGIGALGDVVADSIRAFGEAQIVTAQTEAALKSTGDAAGLTADQIGDLADSIATYSGQDDEAIQKGENLLLTFTNIRDAAGAGNDIFSQTTKFMVDMAQAMGGDASGAAIQLGKALNDPVKGLAALTRVGVAFSAEQKTAIANFVKMGDTASAQRVILAELNREFGGSAEAFGNTLPGSMAKFNVAIGNLEEKVGGALAGPLADLATWFTTMMGVVPPANAAVQAQLDIWAAMAAQAPKAAEGAQQVGDAIAQSGDKSLIGLLAIEEHLTGLAGLWDQRADAKLWADTMQDLGDQVGRTGLALDQYVQAGIDAGQSQEQIRASLQKLVDEAKNVPPALDAAGASVATLATDVQTAAPQVVGAVTEMGSEARAALRERFREMATDALTLGGDLASNLKADKGIVQGAMKELTWAMEHPWKLAHERMRIEAALTGSQLAEGLASANPEIRAIAQQQQAILEAQWEKITGQAWVDGADAGSAWAGGYRSHAIVGGVNTGSAAYRQALRRRYRQQHPRGHAAGGVIEAGEWGIVGEQGPELVRNVGSSAVEVVPNNRLQGMGSTTINVNFHTAYPPSPMEGERIAQALAPHLRREMSRIGA